MKLRRGLLFILSVSICATAQYVQSNSVTTVDSVVSGNCGTTNCYYGFSGHLDQVSGSIDGQLYGVNQSLHTAYQYNFGTHTWAQLSGSTFYKVSVGATDTVWVLTTLQCGWGYQLATYNTTTNVLTPYPSATSYWCFHDISAAFDGSVWALGSVNGNDYSIYVIDSSTQTYHQHAGGVVHFAAFNKMLAYGVSSGGGIWKMDDSTNTNTQMPGSAVDVAVGQDGAGGVQIYVRNTTQPFKWTGTTWRAFYSSGHTWKGMAAGAPNLVFFIDSATGSNLYHLSDYQLAYQTVTSGSYATYCSRQPNGCPLNSYHTAKATSKFNSGGLHGANGVTGSSSGSPSANLYASAMEVGTNCDLLFGDPTSPACSPVGLSSATCTVMGTLISTPPSTSIQRELCYAGYKSLGREAGSCFTVNYIEFCNYDVTPWCSNTAHPDFYINGILAEPSLIGDNVWGWVTDIRELCWRWGPGYPWNAQEIFPLIERFSYFSPVACTATP